jgi:hypothetical protein
MIVEYDFWDHDQTNIMEALRLLVKDGEDVRVLHHDGHTYLRVSSDLWNTETKKYLMSNCHDMVEKK